MRATSGDCTNNSSKHDPSWRGTHSSRVHILTNSGQFFDLDPGSIEHFEAEILKFGGKGTVLTHEGYVFTREPPYLCLAVAPAYSP